MFILAACVHIFGVTFYGFFCSGELQPWADPSLEEQKTFAMDEFGQAKPPLPPPPMTMQSEFIVRTSLFNARWNLEIGRLYYLSDTLLVHTEATIHGRRSNRRLE